MATLVIGGTGRVGSLIVSSLLDRGEAVTLLTRSAERAATAPAGAQAVVGNLADPPSLQGIFSGCDKLMLITASHPDETVHGQNAVRAAKKAGVRKIVYSSVIMPPGSQVIPNFAAKIPIETAVRESGVPFTILRPSSFFQNDLWYQDAMLQFGVYPQPIGPLGLPRIDIRDIADAAVNALLSTKLDGKTINLCCPDILNGKDTARIWSEHLRTEVNYMGDDLDQWGQAAAQFMPGWMVHDLKIMYGFFQKNHFKIEAREVADAESAIGHSPRRYPDFVTETAAVWRAGQ